MKHNIHTTEKQSIVFYSNITIKFRLSDHCLQIEKGRHNRPITPREERFCPFCPESIKNEIHFLMECPAYSNRDSFFHERSTLVPNFPLLNAEEKFKYLMLQENDSVNSIIIKQVSKWFVIRSQKNTNITQQDCCKFHCPEKINT